MNATKWSDPFGLFHSYLIVLIYCELRRVNSRKISLKLDVFILPMAYGYKTDRTWFQNVIQTPPIIKNHYYSEVMYKYSQILESFLSSCKRGIKAYAFYNQSLPNSLFINGLCTCNFVFHIELYKNKRTDRIVTTIIINIPFVILITGSCN